MLWYTGGLFTIVAAAAIGYFVTRDAGDTGSSTSGAIDAAADAAPVADIAPAPDDGEVVAEPASPADEPAAADQVEPATEPEPEPPPAPEPEPEPEIPNGWDEVDDHGDSGRSPAAGGEGADIRLYGFFVGSSVFEMTVEGDGEAMATDPMTNWYNPRFKVNNDPSTNLFDDPTTGFAVDVKWSRGGAPSARMTDGEENEVDAVIDVEWVSPTLLRVTVAAPGPQIEVTRSRVELAVRTQDAHGNTVATFGDDAFWATESSTEGA